jgi:OmpA-OmpF porin, OOP family
MLRFWTFSAVLAAGLAFAQPAAACAPVTIYFEWNSAKLSKEAEAALERLALSLAWKGPDLAHILLTSHTDTSGSPAANRAIALKRAEAVKKALMARHVPGELIKVRAVGAEAPRVTTDWNVREPRNRRVELLVQMSAAAQERQIKAGEPIC